MSNPNGHRTHGFHGTRFYNLWKGVKKRCYQVNSKAYKRYGGRGIGMCQEWRDDPIQFIKWCEQQEPIPSGYTLERKDNNGDYSPLNCCFASPAEQSRNTRKNVWVERGGERLILKDFVERHGVVSYQTARDRTLHGWSPLEAAMTPSLGTGRHRKGVVQ